jgi:hypothetical protein
MLVPQHNQTGVIVIGASSTLLQQILYCSYKFSSHKSDKFYW